MLALTLFLRLCSLLFLNVAWIFFFFFRFRFEVVVIRTFIFFYYFFLVSVSVLVWNWNRVGLVFFFHWSQRTSVLVKSKISRSSVLIHNQYLHVSRINSCHKNRTEVDESQKGNNKQKCTA